MPRTCPFLALVSALSASLIACSSSSTTSPTADAALAADMGMAAEASAAGLNGCTTFEDHTADTDARSITWNLSVMDSPAHCMKIKVGQTVVWNGVPSAHPLKTFNGDAANPIASVVADAAANTQTVKFSAAGSFGYECAIHTTSMMGAILVAP
jgi:plastocyanin